MTEPLVRDDIVGLLEQLGSDRDEDVLDAARQLHARITAAGVSWEELLASDDRAAEGPRAVGAAQAGNNEQHEPSAEDTEAPATAAGDDAQSLMLIDKMLAKSDISEDFRSELEGYKADIAGGEFEDSDRRYIHALYERLS
jgi:hypothetical protein